MTPLLPLEQFREAIGYNPFHFWGMTHTRVPLDSKCNTVVAEYAWQSRDAGGREELRRAIENAEYRMLEQLGFSVAPRFAVSTRTYPHYYNRSMRKVGYYDASGGWISVALGEGKVRSVGVEELTLIGTPAVTLTDADSDGLNDTFTTAVLATTVTDPKEIVAYFIPADRLDSDAVGERWRIQPVKVTITGGNVTLLGRSWTIVKPLLYQGMPQAQGIDPTLAGSYAGNLAIYRRRATAAGTTLASAQGVMYWETAPWPECATCAGGGSDPAGEASAIARVSLRDPENGILGIGEAAYDAVSGIWSSVNCDTFCRPPDRVLIRHYSGDDTDAAGNMQARWRTAVVRLACAELMHRISTCDAALRELYKWQLDLARAGGTAIEQFTISQEDLNNPFGTKAGQVYAWKAVKSVRQIQGVLA